MPKIVQINQVVRNGSTGRIVDQIGDIAIARGWESTIAYSGRPKNISNSDLIQVGNKIDAIWHAIQTRVFDRHGLSSIRATNEFVQKLKELKPDVIHLHNIHGYFLNYEILFNF